jgi:hypothetical protein
MKKHLPTGFSLVEVTLAMGLLTFVLAGLVGLLASGLQTSKASSEDVTAAHFAAAVIEQRRSAPLSTATNMILPALNDAVKCPTSGVYRGIAYLTREGAPSGSVDDRYYRVDYLLSRDAAGRIATLHLSLLTPWQALPAELPPSQGSAAANTRLEVTTFLRVPSP